MNVVLSGYYNFNNLNLAGPSYLLAAMPMLVNNVSLFCSFDKLTISEKYSVNYFEMSIDD